MSGKRIALTLAVLVATFWLAAGSAKAQGVKIAVVDLYRVVSETEDGKSAKNELESYFGKKQSSLDKKSEGLKVRMDDLKKKQKIMSQDDYQEEVEDLQAEMVELQNTYVKYQKLVANKEMELTDPILKKVESVLKKIGEGQGYSMILRKEAVAWIPEAKDITEEVIKQYNKEPAIDFKKKLEEGGKETKDTKKPKGTK